jgi:hypothetical protein
VTEHSARSGSLESGKFYLIEKQSTKVIAENENEKSIY